MANIKRISPAEAKQLVDEGWVYLDVRSEPEFAAGHPVGAQNVPLMHAGARGMTPNTDFLPMVEALYAKDAKIVLGCRSGGRSLRAAEMMAGAGYTSMVDQRAGFEGSRDAFGQLSEPGWAPAGLPVETATSGGSYAELKQKAGRGG
jgi:rhodanese-related sulfurtransferase